MKFPDLHPGNILIVSKENRIGALIHDFGRCYQLDLNVPQMSKASLISFCSEFLKASSRPDLLIPDEIKSLIKEIQSLVELTESFLNGDGQIVFDIKHMHEEIIAFITARRI